MLHEENWWSKLVGNIRLCEMAAYIPVKCMHCGRLLRDAEPYYRQFANQCTGKYDENVCIDCRVVVEMGGCRCIARGYGDDIA